MIKKIQTKKNTLIFDFTKKLVTKIFTDNIAFEKEFYVYRKNPPFAPKLIDFAENRLIIKFIEGCDLFKLKNPDFGDLAKLFFDFHSFFDNKISFVDTNPHNIIFSYEYHRFFLIDFSEHEKGNTAFDLVHFLLFWAEIYDEHKFKNLSSKFIDSYLQLQDIKKELWIDAIDKAIRYFDLRRKNYNKKERLKGGFTKENREFLISLVG